MEIITDLLVLLIAQEEIQQKLKEGVGLCLTSSFIKIAIWKSILKYFAYNIAGAQLLAFL